MALALIYFLPPFPVLYSPAAHRNECAGYLVVCMSALLLL
jgi:hypothetical protein